MDVTNAATGRREPYTLQQPDNWLEHDARHIAQGDFGTPYSLATFANRVLAMIGAPTEREATMLRNDIALQDAVECRTDGRP